MTQIRVLARHDPGFPNSYRMTLVSDGREIAIGRDPEAVIKARLAEEGWAEGDVKIEMPGGEPVCFTLGETKPAPEPEAEPVVVEPAPAPKPEKPKPQPITKGMPKPPFKPAKTQKGKGRH